MVPFRKYCHIYVELVATTVCTYISVHMPLFSVGVSCSQLDNPSNGRVNTSAGISFGDVASFSCDGGYTRNGPAERTCQANGLWNGSMPTCESEYTLVMSTWMWTEQFPFSMSGSHICEWLVIPKNCVHSCSLIMFMLKSLIPKSIHSWTVYGM